MDEMLWRTDTEGGLKNSTLLEQAEDEKSLKAEEGRKLGEGTA